MSDAGLDGGVDLTEPRVERIRTLREGVRERLGLFTKFYVALLAASLTVAGSAAVAASAGQLVPEAAVSIGSPAMLLVGAVLRGLVKARREWDAAVADSVQAIDRLMEEEVETDVDDPTGDAD